MLEMQKSSGSVWSKVYRLWKRYPIVPLFITVMFVLMAIFGEAISPYPPNRTDLAVRMVPPFWQDGGSVQHVLGTDAVGRDLLSRIMAGARMSFIVALSSILLGGFIGTVIGIVSGYYGGRVDSFLMRVADSTLAFPIVLLAMLLALVLGASLMNVVISLSIVLWARYARVIRGEVLSFRRKDFITFSKITGASSVAIMRRHVFPNIRSTLVVLLTLQIGWVIIVEASLSFIGAGIPGPYPVWGSMIAGGREYISTAWWIPFFPGLCVSLVCLCFNMLGDWLREALDPKMRQAVGGGS